MKDLLTKLRKFLCPKDVNKKRVKSFAISVLITVSLAILMVLFQDSLVPKMSSVIMVVAIIAFFILAFFIWFMAGLVVFRALFFVGASLTLLIFISQTYCDSVGRTAESDNALVSIIIFGVLYIGSMFFITLYKEIFGVNNEDGEAGKDTFPGAVVENEKGAGKWLFLVLYSVFVATFLSQFYLVLKPIFDNLCVF